MKSTIEKRNWSQVRHHFEELNPDFVKIVDELDPPDDFCLYEVTYPYGSMVVKSGRLHVPNDNGDLVPLGDSSLDSYVSADLSYNLGSNPCAFMLENCMEVFINLDDRVIPLYDFLKPGSFSGTWQVLAPELAHYPEFLWNMSAGARSIFMLAKISEATANNKLKRTFALTTNKPRNMLEHWYLFREIAAHPKFPKPWACKVLFFSGKWFKQLEDPVWHDFHRFLYAKAWTSSEFWRNQFVWNVVFSSIQKNRQIKASAHIINTVQHLLFMGAGFSPGFVPAIDDSVAPVSAFQEIYLDIYNFKNYAPTMMHAHTLNLYDDSRPLYYSLQYPTATTFSPKSSGHSSTISDLYEVKMVMDKYLAELHAGNIEMGNTVISHMADRIELEYFHSDIELYHDMKPSKEIPKEDPTFAQGSPKNACSDAFPNNSSFVRGCIRVSHKKRKQKKG